ncbi:hypothetical protein BD779DRAFT_1681285 [Infundibulicybe gibba]|nr:hypothetical protein BD779DRAFT_1681285 [Infundibulicybe gibba]
MPSPYETNEDGKSLWLEHSNYIATHIAAVAYGFHATVFFAVVYFMFSKSQHNRNRRRAGWLLLSITFFIAGTIHLACSIGFNEAAWISERGYPGGPLAFFTEQQSIPIVTVEGGWFTVATALAEGLLLYRVYILWDRIWYIVLPLGLFYITTIGSTLNSPHGAAAREECAAMVNLGVITWTLLMAINIVLSGMIALRILLMRRSIGRVLGREHAKVYTGTAALVIETALPFVVVSAVLLGLFGGRNTSSTCLSRSWHN